MKEKFATRISKRCDKDGIVSIPWVVFASLAAGGSLLSNRNKVSVVKSLSPFGCMTDFDGVWSVAVRGFTSG